MIFVEARLCHTLGMIAARPPIAIVEDDPSVREALLGLLRAAGHSAVAFGAAEALLHDPARDRFGCVVSDVMLPGQSGLALAAELTAQPRRVPVILMTARADLADRGDAAGALAILIKPFDPDALIDWVERALGT